MYLYLFVVGSKVNGYIFSCILVEYKRVRVDWAFHSTEMTVNEMCNFAKRARFTVNVTFISQLAMFFRNFFLSMWQTFSGLASTF